MIQDTTVNANIAQCLKESSYFGHTLVTNVCNGKTSIIPWGGADWALAWFFIIIGILILISFLGFIKWMIFDEF